jgi:hippurate hydrolase
MTNPEAGTRSLVDTFEDLHRHPELSFEERRTAGVAAAALTRMGFEVQTGIGGTGVVGTLSRGHGPAVWLRADMDALPIGEATGLPYSSVVDGVSHACGHDVHVTCLLGAAAALRDRNDWRGTIVAVFQPAEETTSGAKAMVEDGITSRFPRPTVVLGQHVAPLPAGTLGYGSGPVWAASDSITITIFGRGGHGSRPETTIDPVVIAAATILRLQTIVSRETSAADTVVLTVGAVNAGVTHNVIPDTATLMTNFRTYDLELRARVLGSIVRIVNAEAAAAGATRPPEVRFDQTSPTLVNDPVAGSRTLPALESAVGAGNVVNPGPLPSSEDVQVLATAVNAPLVFWLLGGADPALFDGRKSAAEILDVVRTLPSNHSPLFHPVVEPTLRIGVAALVSAALAWLDTADRHAGAA